VCCNYDILYCVFPGTAVSEVLHVFRVFLGIIDVMKLLNQTNIRNGQKWWKERTKWWNYLDYVPWCVMPCSVIPVFLRNLLSLCKYREGTTGYEHTPCCLTLERSWCDEDTQKYEGHWSWLSVAILYNFNT
jgi:hypothetical protein